MHEHGWNTKDVVRTWQGHSKYVVCMHSETTLFSSPELLAHGQQLGLLDVRHVSSIIRLQQLLQMTSLTG